MARFADTACDAYMHKLLTTSLTRTHSHTGIYNVTSAVRSTDVN